LSKKDSVRAKCKGCDKFLQFKREDDGVVWDGAYIVHGPHKWGPLKGGVCKYAYCSGDDVKATAM